MPDKGSRPFQKLLVANRSEIAIRVFRSAHELGIRTVAIYSHEDRFALHRFKADEAYRVGKPGEPIRAYLDIPAIVALAKRERRRRDPPRLRLPVRERRVRPRLRATPASPSSARGRSCSSSSATRSPPGSIAEEGGRARSCPAATSPVAIDRRGARRSPRSSATRSSSRRRWAAAAAACASSTTADKLDEAHRARPSARPAPRSASPTSSSRSSSSGPSTSRCSSSATARQPRPPLRARLLGPAAAPEGRRDRPGPEPRPDDCGRRILDAAVAVGRAVGLDNAGTVEFLVDVDAEQVLLHRGQPAHPGRAHRHRSSHRRRHRQDPDPHRRRGTPLTDPEIGLGDQDDDHARSGFAIQCRVTTEDPANHFIPDYGRLTHYRSRRRARASASTAAPAFTGAVITPFYDSLLVKVTASGLRFDDAARRMERCLQEFRIRGVKTNIPFLLNLVTHPTFLAGDVTTRFIDETPELFQLPARRDRATQAAELHRRGDRQRPPGGEGQARPAGASVPTPAVRRTAAATAPPPKGTRDQLQGARAGEVRGVGPRAEAAAASPTRRCATRTSRCWRRGCGRTTCCAIAAALRPRGTPTCSRWRCGAGRRSTRRCGS